MKLEIFSGTDITAKFFDDLNALLKLNDDQIQLVLNYLLAVSRKEFGTGDLDGLKNKLNADKKTFAAIRGVTLTLLPRILSGKATPGAIAELCKAGNIPKDKIEALLSIIGNLSPQEKNQLKAFTLNTTTTNLHAHLQRLRWETQIRPVEDNSQRYAYLPYLIVRFEVSSIDGDDKVWQLELAPLEVDDLIKTVNELQKDYERAVSEYKKCFGEMLTTGQSGN